MMKSVCALAVVGACLAWFYGPAWETGLKKTSLSLGEWAEPDKDEYFFNVHKALLRTRTLEGYNVSVLNDDPLIVQFENFLSAEECEHMKEWAVKNGLQRSTTTGSLMSNGKFDRPVSSSRTSSNAWCQGECASDELMVKIDERIAHVSNLPAVHQEHYQLLKYEVGEEYKTHNDHIYDQMKKPSGVRVLTFFLYLNTVEEGGETAFPNLGIEVKPVEGRAIMWPNVMMDGTDSRNDKTDHWAKPVLVGEKWGANKWIHRYDFITPWVKGLTG